MFSYNDKRTKYTSGEDKSGRYVKKISSLEESCKVLQSSRSTIVALGKKENRLISH